MTNLNQFRIHTDADSRTGVPTAFVPLPYNVRRVIELGCQCPYCKANPERTPKWDTLAISIDGETWIVHYPEIANRFENRQ